jgi:hypothetical protein
MGQRSQLMGHFIGLSMDMRKRTKDKALPSVPDSQKKIPQIISRASISLIYPFHYDGAVTLELNASEATIHRQSRSEVQRACFCRCWIVEARHFPSSWSQNLTLVVAENRTEPPLAVYFEVSIAICFDIAPSRFLPSLISMLIVPLLVLICISRVVVIVVVVSAGYFVGRVRRCMIKISCLVR